MADVRWTGNATAVAQVDTITVGGTVEADDIFILTVTGWDGTSYALSTVAGSTTKSEVATTIAAAWNASTNALLTPITATTDGDDVILTADTAGDAFSVAATTTETGGGAADDQTFVRAATTANGGPKDWSDTDNWDTGALPGGAASQDVYIENFSGDILYGLDQSGIANTLASLNIGQSMTGRIGENGATGYSGTYLQIKATLLNIGYHNSSGTPTGSSRIMVDLGSTASTVTVENSGTSTDTNKPAIRLLANSASTDIEVRKGKVGVGFEAGETSTVGTISEGFVSQINTDANLYIGSGVTMTTLSKTGGYCSLGCAATTVTNAGGNMTTTGTGAITTLTATKGTITSNATGTVGTALAKSNGTIDFSKSAEARTVTTAELGLGGKIIADSDVMTFTNEIAAETGGKVTYTAA